MNNAERLIEAFSGDVSRSGKQRKLGEEVAALFGVRASTLDARKSLYFYSRKFKDIKSDAQHDLRRTITDPNKLDEGELEETYIRMRIKRAQIYNDLGKVVNAAKSVGMSREDIITTLRGARISRRDALMIADGLVPPWRMHTPTVRAKIKSTYKDIGTEAGERMSERYRLLRELSRNY